MMQIAEQDRLQFVTDDAGNKTAVILSISLFESRWIPSTN